MAQVELIRDWQAAQLFPAEFAGFRAEIQGKALARYGRFPEIGVAIEADLDRHGLTRKRAQAADRRWGEALGAALPGLEPGEVSPVGGAAASESLGVGRPRTLAVVVYLFVVLRGCAASLSGLREWESLRDSATLRAALWRLGAPMPGLSTVKELLAAVSTGTRETILRCQLAQACELGLDDMQVQIVDSTAVASASAWPNEAALVEGFLRRARKLGRGL